MVINLSLALATVIISGSNMVFIAQLELASKPEGSESKENPFVVIS